MSIVASFPTRQSILNHLATIKDQPNFKELERDVWVQHARNLRPRRLATILQLLVMAAEAQETTTYGELLKNLRHGSHNELNHLVRFLGQLCKDSGWPPLPVLIKKQDTQKVGAGFFKDYLVPDVTNPTQVDFDRWEKRYEQDCYARVPDQIEISFRLAVFISSGQLSSLPN